VSGFTLVETLVAAAVLAIGVMGIALLQRQTLSTQSDIWQQAAALHAAQSCIELGRLGIGTCSAALVDPSGTLGSAPSFVQRTVNGRPGLEVSFTGAQGVSRRILVRP